MDDLDDTSTRRGASADFRHGDREDAVAQVGGDSIGIDGGGSSEGAAELAVSALDLVIVLARDARVAPALQGQPAVVDVDAYLVAGETRQFGGEDERACAVSQRSTAGAQPCGPVRPAARAGAEWRSDRGTGPSAQTPRCLAS